MAKITLQDVQPDAQMLVTQALFLCNPEKQILILQLPDGRWQLPGGKVKHGEPWDDAIRRELIEETDITDVQIHRPIYVDNWHTQTQNYYRSYFLCTTQEERIILSGDHINYRWIDKKADLTVYNFTHATVKQHIKQFFADYIG